jgi:DNA-binding CsgD family transcriptional regulator
MPTVDRIGHTRWSVRGSAARTPASLVERDDAIGALAHAWRGALEMAPSVTVIEAAAGMGKSAVLRHGIARARRAGMVVGEVAGLEVEAELPFALAARLLGPVIARTRGRRGLFDGAAAPARAVLDDGAAAISSPTITVALARVIERLADAPLALVVDDAQWSDPASLGVLRYVGARLDGQSLAIVVATRPHEDGDARRELDALTHLPSAAVVDLPPLSTAGTARVLREVAGAATEVTDETAAACVSLTGGNPFFVREVASELRSNPAGTKVEIAAVPTVERRLAGLSPAALSLARAAAVLGNEFDLDRAVAVAKLRPDVARQAVGELRHAAIVDEARAAFVHSLVARAVVGSASATERGALHARAARELRANGAHPIIVAKHLLHTDADGDDVTVADLVEAAGAARRAGQPRLAVTFADRAAAEPPVPGRRAAVDRELARSRAAAGDRRWRDHAAAAIARLEPLEGSRLLELIGRDLYSASHIAEAEHAYAWALDLASGAPDAALRLLARYVQSARVRVDRPSRRLELLDRLDHAVASYPQRDSVEWREAAGCLAYQRAITGAPATGVDDLATAALDPERVTSEEILHPVTYLTALQAASMVGADVEVAATERALAVGRHAARPAIVQSLLAYRGVRHLREGRVDAAVDDLEEAYRLGPLSPVLLPKLAADRALGLHERGSTAAAWASIETLDADDHDSTGYFNGYLRVRGVLRAASGDVTGAIEDLFHCGDRERRVLAPGAVAIPWAFDVAPLLVAVGRADEAAALVAPALRSARAQGVPFRVAHGLRAAATLEPPERAESLLREALDVLAGSPWRLEQLEVELALARLLVDTRRGDAAACLLRTIADAGHRTGAGRLVQSALALLRTTGARPRRLAVTGHDALTPAERVVVGLAVAGGTNREIAERRGVSTKAVEHHLGNAYRKLGVRSRAELIARYGSQMRQGV